MPIAMTQEQQALQASLRDWAKRASTIAVTRALEPGSAPEPARAPAPARAPEPARAPAPAPAGPMNDLAALGVFAIPRDGTVTDLAAALEQLASALTPGPVLPAVLASLLLARAGVEDQPGVSVALAPGTLTGTRQPDGTLKVAGETGPLLWAGGTPARPIRRRRRRRRVVPARPGPAGRHRHEARPG